MEALTETNSEMGEAEPSVPKAVIGGRVELRRHTSDDRSRASSLRTHLED
jgi:hypothetical protein